MKKVMRLHVIILILLAQGAVCQQSWDEESTNKAVNSGESVTLSCKILDLEGTCFWKKDGKRIKILKEKNEFAGDKSTGDCSLRIFNATMVDDGQWECHGTDSTVGANYYMISKKFNLVVIASPSVPDLTAIHPSRMIKRSVFTVEEGFSESIKCQTRFGNPPTLIKWFLGPSELSSHLYTLKNQQEAESPKTWQSASILQMSFDRSDNKKTLKCIAWHASFDVENKSSFVQLDVLYSPRIKVKIFPAGDIEEGQSIVKLQCISDANPPATYIWKKIGKDQIISFQETLEFHSVTRENSGHYICLAKNKIGFSDPTMVELDVKYPPERVHIDLNGTSNVLLHSNFTYGCNARANYLPLYEWFQVLPTGEKFLVGSTSNLSISNASYTNGGKYFCVAYNYINNSRREQKSQAVEIIMYGPPQILPCANDVQKLLKVTSGRDAVLQFEFCSNPPPSEVTWSWQNKKLDAGNGKGRHIAERLFESTQKYCYCATLRLQNVVLSDVNNSYSLIVTNIYGKDNRLVLLDVKEPISMVFIIGITMVCLVSLALLTIGTFYAFKSEKFCFSSLLLASFPAYVPTKHSGIRPYEGEDPAVNLWLQKSFEYQHTRSSVEGSSNDSLSFL